MNYLNFLKQHKQPIKNTKFLHKNLLYGKYGLYVLENGQLTLNQLEALKKKLSVLFKSTKYWSYLPQAKPKTSKTAGSRMGSGKGEIHAYVFNVLKGSVLLEWNLSLKLPDLRFFRLLPIKVCILKKSL